MPFQEITMPAKPIKYAVIGPTGAGKTHWSLALMYAFTKNGKVAMLDSESGRGTLFAKMFPGLLYQRLTTSFHPNRYVAVIAEACGLQVNVAAMPQVSLSGADDMVTKIATATTPIVDGLVIDSLTHAWNDQDGILDLVNKSGGQFQDGWRKVGTPYQKRIMGAIIRAPIHIGVTMRSKMDYVLEEVTNKAGQKVQSPKRVGLQPEQRDNTLYDFDFALEIGMDHACTVSKCPPIPSLSNSVWGPNQVGELASVIMDWMTTEAKVFPEKVQPEPAKSEDKQPEPPKDNNKTEPPESNRPATMPADAKVVWDAFKAAKLYDTVYPVFQRTHNLKGLWVQYEAQLLAANPHLQPKQQ